MKLTYGEGRAERAEVEAAGEYACVPSIDGGNVGEYIGGPTRMGNGRSGGGTIERMTAKVFDFFGETASCLARARLVSSCL